MVLTDLLSTTNTAEYIWNTGATTPTITIKEAGIYTVKKTEILTDKCYTKDTIRVTVGNGVGVDAGADKYTCDEETVALNAHIRNQTIPPYEFKWSPTTGLDAPYTANPTLEAGVYGTYIVEVRDASPTPCLSYDTIIIQPAPQMTLQSNFNRTRICKDDSVEMNVRIEGGLPFSTGYHVQWTPSTNLVNANRPRTIAFPEQTTVYTLAVRDSFLCEKHIDVEIIVSDPEIAFDRENVAICSGQATEISASIENGIEPYTLQWYIDDSLQTNTDNNMTVDRIGVYRLDIADILGCGDSKSVEVFPSDIDPPDDVSINAPDSAFNNEPIALSAEVTGEGLEFSWSTSAPNTFENDATQETNYVPDGTEEGLFTFEVLVQNICGESSNNVSIIIIQPPQFDNHVFVPNIIVPNDGDENINHLKVYSNTIAESNFVFTIFNRNGRIVYSTEDSSQAADIGWNGIDASNNTQLASDVFTYVVKGEYVDGKSFETKGTVTVVY